MLGPVSEADKAWYFKTAWLFMLPSLAEGFGAPVVEADEIGETDLFVGPHVLPRSVVMFPSILKLRSRPHAFCFP